MPVVDMYIGPKRPGPPWWRTCLITLAILIAGAYFIIVFLAANGIYIASGVPLPEDFQPTATPLPTPTESAQSHLQKADAYFADGQLEAAVMEYEQVIAKEPQNDAAYARIVKPLILLRRVDDAAQWARKAVQLNDQKPENLGALAEALDWQGNYAEAIDYALRATEIDPKYAAGYAYAAEIYADLNRQDKALAAAQKAIQLDDNSADAHRNLAYVYEARGNYRAATAEHQRALQLAPKYAYIYIGLARNQRILNRTQDAVATLQQAQKIAPKDPQVYDELGWTYALAGDYPRAIAQLKKAIELEPKFEVPYGHLGHVYFVQQNWQDAVANLEKAIQNEGTRLEYYYKLGIAYVNLNECAKGKPWVDKATQVNPVDAAVQGAAQWYQQHCESAPPTPTRRR
ncbi:MAG: tetratricopeptide repeat protein [Chloroflexi bacterium]|nr:tetratricopeptide repeat protein [Chloroflexota bacterium]